MLLPDGKCAYGTDLLQLEQNRREQNRTEQNFI